MSKRRRTTVSVLLAYLTSNLQVNECKASRVLATGVTLTYDPVIAVIQYLKQKNTSPLSQRSSSRLIIGSGVKERHCSLI